MSKYLETLAACMTDALLTKHEQYAILADIKELIEDGK